MKPETKPKKQNDQVQQSAPEASQRSKRIHLTLVTEEEREKYRVPSYEYIL